MDIAEQKQEILHLLEQLNSGGAGLQRRERGQQRAVARPSQLNDRILRRRQELVELRNRRDRVSQDLLEERILSLLQMLDQRISRIEHVVNQVSPPHSQPLGQKEHNENTLASDQGGGTQIASDFDAMMPDLDIKTSTVNEGAPDSGHTLSGAIQEGILPDILQMLSSNTRTGVFGVEEGDKKVELYLRDGEIFHAVTDGMVGQAAFFAAMAIEGGRFYFDESDDLPDEKTIDGNTQFMILEALRQIDENQGEG